MSYKEKRNVVQLSEAERRELKEASREIAARFDKINQIVARKLDLAPQTQGEFQVEFRCKKIIDIEIGPIEIRYPDGTIVCYQDPPGVCCKGPCPCT